MSAAEGTLAMPYGYFTQETSVMIAEAMQQKDVYLVGKRLLHAVTPVIG